MTYVIDYFLDGKLWATDFNSPNPPTEDSASIPNNTTVESIDRTGYYSYVINLTKTETEKQNEASSRNQ